MIKIKTNLKKLKNGRGPDNLVLPVGLMVLRTSCWLLKERARGRKNPLLLASGRPVPQGEDPKTSRKGDPKTPPLIVGMMVPPSIMVV